MIEYCKRSAKFQTFCFQAITEIISNPMVSKVLIIGTISRIFMRMGIPNPSSSLKAEFTRGKEIFSLVTRRIDLNPVILRYWIRNCNYIPDHSTQKMRNRTLEFFLILLRTGGDA